MEEKKQLIEQATIDDIEAKLEEYLELTAQPAKRSRGANRYACPICHSGEGADGTSAMKLYRATNSFYCHKCHNGGSIFKLIELTQNITGFREQVEAAAGVLGVPVRYTDGQTAQTIPTRQTKQTRKVEEVQEATADFSEYINRCRINTADASGAGMQYLTGRGFTAATVERFNLGYDTEYSAIVIPYNNKGNYYSTRSTVKSHDKNPFYKPSETIAGGAEPVYNKAALYTGKPCFICEAPFDAISYAQAGAQAVAIGGTGCSKLIRELTKKKPTGTLIIAIDNPEKETKDSSRENNYSTRSKLKEELERLQLSYIEVLALPGGDAYKDANEYLQADPTGFVYAVSEVAESAQSITDTEQAERAEQQQSHYLDAYKADFITAMQAVKLRISTGMSELDKALNGGLADELYILAAETGQGKSAFSMNLAENIAASGTDVIYFALEMSRKELIARGVSRITYEQGKPYSAGDILYYRYDESIKDFSQLNYNNYEAAVDEYFSRYGSRLIIRETENGGITADDIYSFVVKHIETTGRAPVVFVDYLQMIAPSKDDRGQTDRKNKLDYAIRKLKGLSIKYRVPVFTISSLNRDGYGGRVTAKSLKESGDLEYTGGIILGLNLKLATTTNNPTAEQLKEAIEGENGARAMILEVLKYRNGKKNNDVELQYYYKNNYFTEPAAASYRGKKGMDYSRYDK